MAAHGYNKFFGPGGLAGTAGWFDSMGMKPGKFHARVAASTEMAAGLGLAVGLLTPIPAAGFVSLMFVAAWTVHRHNGFFIVKEGWEYNLILAVAAVADRADRRGQVQLGLRAVPHQRRSTTTCTAGGASLIAVGARAGRRHRPAGDLLPAARQDRRLRGHGASSRTIRRGPLNAAASNLFCRIRRVSAAVQWVFDTTHALYVWSGRRHYPHVATIPRADVRDEFRVDGGARPEGAVRAVAAVLADRERSRTQAGAD